MNWEEKPFKCVLENCFKWDCEAFFGITAEDIVELIFNFEKVNCHFIKWEDNDWCTIYNLMYNIYIYSGQNWYII